MTKIIECLKCKQFPELTQEQITVFTEMLFGQNLKMSNILDMLDGFGKCIDGKRHRTDLDPEYLKNTQKFVNKLKEEKQNFKKTEDELNQTNEKIKQLEIEIQNAKELQTKISETLKDIPSKIADIKTEFETTSKTIHIELWE